jgi:hypothetical protein
MLADSSDKDHAVKRIDELQRRLGPMAFRSNCGLPPISDQGKRNAQAISYEPKKSAWNE